MGSSKKLIWTFAILVFLGAFVWPLLKWMIIRMDVVYMDSPDISDYRGRGWVPFSRNTLPKASNIRQESDVSSNASFIRFQIPQDDFGSFIVGAKEESQNHRGITCRDDIQECMYFNGDPERIIRFDVLRKTHLGDDEFVFLVDPETGEVFGGAQYPFKDYLLFD